MDVPLVNVDETELLKNIIKNWLVDDGPYQAMDMPLEKNPKCPYFDNSDTTIKFELYKIEK